MVYFEFLKKIPWKGIRSYWCQEQPWFQREGEEGNTRTNIRNSKVEVYLLDETMSLWEDLGIFTPSCWV